MTGESAAEITARVGKLFDRLSGSYNTVVDFFGPFGRALAAAADVDPGSKVLDLACGRGAVLLPMLEAVGASGSVLGVDLAPGMVQQMSVEIAEAGIINAQCRVGDAQDLDLPDGWFDAVTGGFMIFFPPDPIQALREIKRVLKPGGKVALSIFDCEPGFPFQPELEASVGLTREGPGPQNSRFNQASVLEPAMEQVGFRDLTATEVRERIWFRDAEEIEAWQRTTGALKMLESLTPEQLEAYRTGLAERVDPFRADGGTSIELVQRARLIVATKPK